MEKNLSKVDRLCFRMSEDIKEAACFADFFFPSSTWEKKDHGGLGYERAYQVRQLNDLLCTVYAGGETQRGTMYFDVTGKGCMRVNWDDPCYTAAMETFTDAKLRRIDIAVDFPLGEWSLARVKTDYEAGLFTHTRPPLFQVFGDPYGVQGMTYYIGANIGKGKKKQEISFKFYEKGKEQKSEEFPNWTRGELTITPSNKQILLPPSTFIQERDNLFAGAYPALQKMLPNASPLRLQRIQTVEESLEVSLKQCKKQWGAIINAAVHFYDGDILAVFDKICGKHPHPRYMQEIKKGRAPRRATHAGAEAKAN